MSVWEDSDDAIMRIPFQLYIILLSPWLVSCRGSYRDADAGLLPVRLSALIADSLHSPFSLPISFLFPEHQFSQFAGIDHETDLWVGDKAEIGHRHTVL